MKPFKSICLLILLSGVLGIPPVAEAKCMPGTGPVLSVTEKTGEPGAKVTVTGKYFVGVCNDVRVPGDVRPISLPAKGVTIYIVQGDRRQEVARVDANEKNEFSVVVTIPADAAPGPATLLAEYNKAESDYSVKVQPLSFTISAGR
jgi:hypothetical protein